MMSAIHKVLVLVKGNVVYQGHSSGIVDHFQTLQGRPMPQHVRAALASLDIVDFGFANIYDGAAPLHNNVSSLPVLS